jgi:hypothetical protein
MTGYTDEAENLIVDSCLKSICIVKVVGLQDKQTRSVNFTTNIRCMGMHAGIPHIADWCQQGHPMPFHEERQPKQGCDWYNEVAPGPKPHASVLHMKT